ncbi:Magnesium transporter MRS2/LPE10 [Penicillium viridicatum]|nr:Magnesium transporter MRS2/LPE10 [Penicillium viridicatum]
MLSPRLSAPSASLLRFLRSQSGFSAALSACAYPRRLASRDKGFSTGPSPKFSSWTRLDALHGPATLDTTIFSNQHGKPNPARATVSPALVPKQLKFSRHASTKSRPFLRRLFDLKRDKACDYKNQGPTNPGLMDEGTEGMFNIGRSLSAKASNELRIRCTEFDIHGDVTLVNGEFRKQELIAKYGLLPRDLRKIDSSTLPHILVRPRAILINLLHLRVLIKADRVLVFDAYGSTDSYMQSLFIYDLEGKLRQRQSQGAAQPSQSLPYEFRALEAVLISVTSGLEEEFNGVRDPVVRVLRALEEDIDRDKLRHLLIYSKKLGTFEQKARLVRDAIDDLLEADDDLAAMYLSERSVGKEREEDDHQEVEMLLESYHKVCDEIVQASGNLVTNIRNTEEVVKAILDANRNSLMLMDLKFSIGTLGLATGTLFSALYGMNLKNFIEESDFGFGGVSVICFALTGLVCVYGLAKLRKLQRVRMWGESGVGGSTFAPLSPKRSALGGNRNNWRVDSIEPVWGSLPGEARSERMRRLKENSAAAAAQAASRNLKSTPANSQAATQASATASKNARAENGNGDGKETVSPEGST